MIKIYYLTDGGIYDNDQTVNGVIVDPVSLGYAPSGTLPSTGANSGFYMVTVLLLLGVGTTLSLIARRRNQII